MRVLVTGGGRFHRASLVNPVSSREVTTLSRLDDFSTGPFGSASNPVFERRSSSSRVTFGTNWRCSGLRGFGVSRSCSIRGPSRPSLVRWRTRSAPIRSTWKAPSDDVACAATGVRRVVAAGSSSVYGSSPELPRRETQRPDPRSPYAISKLATEQYVHTLGDLHGVETVVLRYFNVFGPAQETDVAVRGGRALVHHRRARGEPDRPWRWPPSRDFTYIDNVVSC